MSREESYRISKKGSINKNLDETEDCHYYHIVNRGMDVIICVFFPLPVVTVFDNLLMTLRPKEVCEFPSTHDKNSEK